MEHENNYIKTVENMYHEMGWLITRLMVDLDKYTDEILNWFPPENVNIEENVESFITERPLKTIKIFTSQYPPLLRAYAAPNYAREVSYKQTRDYWYSTISKALSGKDIETFDTAVVIFIYYFSDNYRIRDPDRFSCKFILDALCWLRVINDDNLKNVMILSRGKMDKNKVGTEIIVADIYQQMERYLNDIYL